MEILLQELYNVDLHVHKHHDRKVYIDTKKSYQITGITKSGKTQLVKSYLLTLKKSSYLYVDCADMRLDREALNRSLATFCLQNKIDTLVLDNYTPDIQHVNVTQLITISETFYDIATLTHLHINPLDYEEFLLYEHKYDSTALNHFLQLGGLPVMHTLHVDERHIYLQNILKNSLDSIEMELFILCAKYNSLKVSAYTLYERLKQKRKISKDKLYTSFAQLLEKRYLYQLPKFQHPKATKKIYLCNIAFKSALSIEKNFGRLFENMIYLELLKDTRDVFYEEGIDFYLPHKDEIILCKPFADERRLFKKLEILEPFIFSYNIKKITVISMNKEGKVSHPLAKVEIIPFDIWALGD